MKELAKKALIILLSAILVCTIFTGCSSKLNADMTEENISATVDTVFDALVKFDMDDLKTYVDSSTLNTILKYAKKYTQFQDLAKAIFANLTYEVENIDIDNGIITVTVYNKDLYDPALEFVDDLSSKYNTLQLLTKITDSSWLDSNLSALIEEIEDAPMDPFGEEIYLTINQKTNNLVLVFDTEAEDGVSGGALSAIKQIYS